MPKLRMMWLVLSFLAFASCSRMEQSSMQQSQRAQQGPDLTTVIPVDPLIIKGTLPSGLTYYIRQNKKPEHRAELRLAVNAGSVLESQDQQGLAHFAEHMAFNGTEHFQKQELVSYLESIGMRFGPEVNAYTSFDETVYMLQLPTDSLEVFRKGFQVLEDWAHEVSYDSTEIDKERGVIVEEWRLGRGAWGLGSDPGKTIPCSLPRLALCRAAADRQERDHRVFPVRRGETLLQRMVPSRADGRHRRG